MQLCILFVIIEVAFSKLRIQSPVINNNYFTDQLDLNFSIANFGHIPYGKKMSGLLYLPPVKEGRSFTFCNISDVEYTQMYFNQFGDKWLLIQRGECPFTRKAINAQQIGAKLIIIVDNKDEAVNSIVMADDGNGYQVKIPSILITKKDGNIGIEYLTTRANSYLAGGVEFETQTQKYPNVTFGLNIENRDTFRLLNEFRPIYEAFNGSIAFNIYYEVLRCFSCENDGWKSQIEDCVGGGRYCQFDPNGADYGNGADVVREQLRQTCVWKYNQTLWWDYMGNFSKTAFKPNIYKKCYTDFFPAAQQLEIDKCVDSSYNTTEKDKGYNSILEEHFYQRYSTGIIFYPGASINNISFRGNIEAIDIKEAICAAMVTEHSSCNQATSIQLITQQAPTYFWLITTVVVSSVLFILFIVFIYRRMQKKSMQREIRDQVSEKVNQYVKFYESRSEK